MSAERRDEVQSALSRLSPRHHQVVVLRYFAELTLSEISGAIGGAGGHSKVQAEPRAQPSTRKNLCRLATGRRGDEH